MSDSFLFYDLETFGADPRRTRIAQFAAVRTDAELNQVEEPLSFFVQPADDLLPSPIASTITGIAPQQALREGMIEAEAASRIVEEMARPGTCTLGYNSLRFDDEFVRHTLFRNFFDPYEREWRGGNSRWDLLDVLRLAHALRPDGLAWPRREDGAPSFKLEHLALANGVRQGDAHEALSDVYATLGLARLLRQAQPRLWDYALKLRDKRHAATLLDPMAMQPVLHVSQRYPASRMCAAAVLPLAAHPSISNRVIVFDLDGDVEALLEQDAAGIADRLYTPVADLPPGVSRVPLKEVHLNRSPMLVPWAHLRAGDLQRLGLDADALLAGVQRLRAHGPALAEKARQVFAGGREHAQGDVDGSLYAGFCGDGDRRLCAQVRATTASELGTRGFDFRDARLPELLFRYRARNWPQALSPAERERWDAYRRQRLVEESGLSEYSFAGYFAQIEALRAAHAGDGTKLALLDRLEHWGRDLRDGL
ncbi:exodeoxyribonuclease I [Pseudoxanthomonas broegbernensis]|uniref:Exodeoxyribonuclease I n=1 Tax=Pseudoxanthomonas broegbernensis TaxID=83619 RepID=A0A7V8GPP9_9GAMM|nr:exodeoxyribonuclease I [Pseudoxanthomonas broegbernensis]KAF1687776.1 exodeoxyribonuclease I [Pseudoxanthomonas broegbernensis]MBB6064814.1 exodeoxyribonuclease-1 [Pseudoxanthomonas broegbernensis]